MRCVGGVETEPIWIHTLESATHIRRNITVSEVLPKE